MIYELELYRRTRTAAPDLPTDIPASTLLRKEMREASDGLMFFALHRQSVVAVATHAANVILQMARTLDATGETPGVPDLVNGACTLIQEVRDRMDRALLLNDGEQLRWSTCMLEIQVRGILAILVGTVPYTTLMETIAERGDLHAILTACGALPPTQTTETPQ